MPCLKYSVILLQGEIARCSEEPGEAAGGNRERQGGGHPQIKVCIIRTCLYHNHFETVLALPVLALPVTWDCKGTNAFIYIRLP